MKTLSDKWDDLIIELDELKKQKINEFKTNNYIPNHFYNPQVNRIITYNVTDISVRIKGFNYFPRYYKKVTKRDLEKLNEYVNSFKTSELEYLINYEYFSSFKTSGAFLFNSLIKSKEGTYYNQSNGLYSSLEEAQEKQNKLKEIYGSKEGYKPCAYCRKQVKIENIIHDRIYVRNSGWVNMDFCSGDCAVNEQMSREG